MSVVPVLSRRSAIRRRPARALLTSASVLAGLVLPLAAAAPASATVPTPPAPACTTSIAPGIPLAVPTTPDRYSPPYVSLTATDNHGLWAGVSFDGKGLYKVITWRNGKTGVLGTFNYPGAWNLGAVDVVGITQKRAVIVVAEDYQVRSYLRERSYRFQYGQRFAMAHNGSWTSWGATSVSPDGHVAGLVRSPSGNQIVEWDRNGTATTIVAGKVSEPLIDQYGDVIWHEEVQNGPGQIGELQRYRSAAGRTGRLIGSGINPQASVASGRWVWGYASDYGNQSSVLTWDMSGSAQTTSVAAVARRPQAAAVPVAGSSTRAYVGMNLYSSTEQTVLYDAYGDGHVLPVRTFMPGVTVPAYAVADNNTVAMTADNGRVYIMHCPLNYAKHNPRGLIYHGAVSGGQTVITGGAFDSDALASHVSVDIYDETTSVRKRLTRIVADQYDPSFSSAYGISGNHRYRYSFPSAAGKHVYCAYGMNIGYGNTNTELGCTTITT